MACLFLNVYYEQEVIIELIKQVKETKTKLYTCYYHSQSDK